jgi:hypothetical protein
MSGLCGLVDLPADALFNVEINNADGISQDFGSSKAAF